MSTRYFSKFPPKIPQLIHQIAKSWHNYWCFKFAFSKFHKKGNLSSSRNLLTSFTSQKRRFQCRRKCTKKSAIKWRTVRATSSDLAMDSEFLNWRIDAWLGALPGVPICCAENSCFRGWKLFEVCCAFILTVGRVSFRESHTRLESDLRNSTEFLNFKFPLN